MNEVSSIYKKKQRQRLIRKEIQRLNNIYRNADEGRRGTIENLINNAAFTSVTLAETREIIAINGITERYQNGASQYGIKKSAALEVYDKLLNTYLKTIAQLNKALPDQDDSDTAGNELIKFINSK
jgi:hypothetical protein